MEHWSGFSKLRRLRFRRVAKANSPTDAWHARVYAVKFLLALAVRAETVPMATFTHDTGGGKWRPAHIDRLRCLHLSVGRKATAIVEEHVALVDALERGTRAAAEASVRRHLQGTLAAAKNIRSGHSRAFLDG